MERSRLGSWLLAALLLVLVPPAAADPHPRSGHPHWPHWERSRGRIGIQVQPMTPDLRAFFGAPADRGVLVSQVEVDRPGARAGLLAGDVVVAVGGEPVAETRELIRAVRSAPAGEPLPLTVLRKGESLEIVVEPEGDAAPLFDPPADPQGWMELFERGMELGSRELRTRIEALERRLEELEQQLQERREEREGQET